MAAIVRIALKYRFTPIVLAIFIVLFGVLAALRTPADIFPDIRIPVIAVVWTYRGLSPDDMAGRVIYYYERQLPTYVNDIEHIESQSLFGIGIVKIFFRPEADIRTATAEVTSLSQTVLKYLPPGITPPLILNYNASTVPVLQLALSSAGLSEQQIYDIGNNQITSAAPMGPGRHFFRWRNYWDALDPVVSGSFYGSPQQGYRIAEGFVTDAGTSGWDIQDRVMNTGKAWLLAHTAYWSYPPLGDDLASLMSS